MVGQVVSRLLVREGYEVHVETDPARALERTRSEPFAAVITDHSMPGMTGVELARQLRADGLRIPILLCSGDVTACGDTTGVDAVLAKPVDFTVLRQRLAALLSGSREDQPRSD